MRTDTDASARAANVRGASVPTLPLTRRITGLRHVAVALFRARRTDTGARARTANVLASGSIGPLICVAGLGNTSTALLGARCATPGACPRRAHVLTGRTVIYPRARGIARLRLVAGGCALRCGRRAGAGAVPGTTANVRTSGSVCPLSGGVAGLGNFAVALLSTGTTDTRASTRAADIAASRGAHPIASRIAALGNFSVALLSARYTGSRTSSSTAYVRACERTDPFASRITSLGHIADALLGVRCTGAGTNTCAT